LASLKESLARNGRKINDTILEQWIQEIDLNKTGTIDFNTFLAVMRNENIETKVNGIEPIKKEEKINVDVITYEIQIKSGTI